MASGVKGGYGCWELLRAICTLAQSAVGTDVTVVAVVVLATVVVGVVVSI